MLADLDNGSATEKGQLLRRPGLGQTDCLRNLGHRPLSTLEQVDDLQSLRMRQETDDPRLDLIERIRMPRLELRSNVQRYAPSCIFEYTSMFSVFDRS